MIIVLYRKHLEWPCFYSVVQSVSVFPLFTSLYFCLFGDVLFSFIYRYLGPGYWWLALTLLYIVSYPSVFLTRFFPCRHKQSRLSSPSYSSSGCGHWRVVDLFISKAAKYFEQKYWKSLSKFINQLDGSSSARGKKCLVTCTNYILYFMLLAQFLENNSVFKNNSYLLHRTKKSA